MHKRYNAFIASNVFYYVSSRMQIIASDDTRSDLIKRYYNKQSDINLQQNHKNEFFSLQTRSFLCNYVHR